MIQMWDENVPNLDVCDLMAVDRADFGECPCDGCEGVLFEAWERMTYGGVVVNYETNVLLHPAMFVQIEGRFHWVPLAAR